MIKKLRRRFIIVNMSILTCVLFGVLAGIFAYMYSSEVRISYELMESIINERDIDVKKPDERMESADILSGNKLPAAEFMSFQMDDNEKFNDPWNMQKPFEPENPPEQYPDNLPERPEQPQERPDDFPERPDNFPERPEWEYPEKDDSSSQPDSEPEDDDSESEPDDDDSSESEPDKQESGNDNSSSEPENNESSVIKPDDDYSSQEKPVNQNLQPATENKTPAVTVNNDEKKPSAPQTEKTVSTTVTALSSTEISGKVSSNNTGSTKTETKTSTEVTVTGTKPEDLGPPPDNEFPDPYRGSVKRAYIMLYFNSEKDVDNIVYQYFDDVDEEEVKKAAKTIINEESDRGKVEIGDYDLRYMKKENPRMMKSGFKLLFLDRTLEISTINRLLFIFIIIASVGVVIIFGISVLLANWTIKPVDKAWQQQKQFVADASHELKTPLTVISANTDVILSNSDDIVKNQSKWLNYIKDETQRMTKLVNSMLYIAKYDANQMKMTESRLNLSDILSSICLQYEAVIFENGKLLETEIDSNIYINGDEDKIKQLINILLDNAKKYSTENGRIKAVLSREQKTGKTVFTVSNTSEYIAPDKLEKLFDRFYRLDDSRNRKTGGSGLGLNIAKSIVEVHGGDITASHNNGITSFTVVI